MWVQNSSFTTFKPIVVGHEPERSQFHPPTLRRVFWRRNLRYGDVFMRLISEIYNLKHRKKGMRAGAGEDVSRLMSQ